MSDTVVIAGVKMSLSAASSIEECGIYVAGDVKRVRDGLTPDEP